MTEEQQQAVERLKLFVAGRCHGGVDHQCFTMGDLRLLLAALDELTTERDEALRGRDFHLGINRSVAELLPDPDPNIPISVQVEDLIFKANTDRDAQRARADAAERERAAKEIECRHALEHLRHAEAQLAAAEAERTRLREAADRAVRRWKDVPAWPSEPRELGILYGALSKLRAALTPPPAPEGEMKALAQRAAEMPPPEDVEAWAEQLAADVADAKGND